MTITIDVSSWSMLALDLARLKGKALPYAVRETLNRTAFEARTEWREQMGKAMTLRNKWTAGSLRVEKAQGISIPSMESRVGSLAPYMGTQESGGTVTGKGEHGKLIPTTTAAGQAMRAKRRTKQVQARNWMSAISLPRTLKGSRQRRNKIAVIMAAKSGGVAFLDLNPAQAASDKRRRRRKGAEEMPAKMSRRKGLFRVTRTGKGNFKVRMIWDMTRRTVVIKRRPTLEPTVHLIRRKAVEWQKQAMIEQFKRHQLFGFRRRLVARFIG